MVPKCAKMRKRQCVNKVNISPTFCTQTRCSYCGARSQKTFGSANDKLCPRYDLSSCGNAQISFRACLEQRVWFGNISWVFKTISVNDQYYCKFAFPLGYWIFNFVSQHNSIRSEIFQSKCRDSSIKKLCKRLSLIVGYGKLLIGFENASWK